MNRGIIICLCSFTLAVLWGCGSKRQTSKGRSSTSTALQNDKHGIASDANANTLVVESIAVLADTLQRSPNATIPVVQDPLAAQKTLGLYKAADFAPAMHYDLRRPNYVIIHHTAQNSVAQTVRTFQVPHSKVSAHYVIGRDGQVIQMLNDYDRAWHAGKSKWGSLTDINSASIGIELDNNGREIFPDAQINSLLILLDTLKNKYYIPQVNFIGHADIAPTRKDDPNITFPWKKLAEKGFGIWYNEAALVDPPATFNPYDALKIMGYDMRNPQAAITAFKRKFIVKDISGVLTDLDKRVLYNLYLTYY